MRLYSVPAVSSKTTRATISSAKPRLGARPEDRPLLPTAHLPHHLGDRQLQDVLCPALLQLRNQQVDFGLDDHPLQGSSCC